MFNFCDASWSFTGLRRRMLKTDWSSHQLPLDTASALAEDLQRKRWRRGRPASPINWRKYAPALLAWAAKMITSHSISEAPPVKEVVKKVPYLARTEMVTGKIYCPILKTSALVTNILLGRELFFHMPVAVTSCGRLINTVFGNRWTVIIGC